MHWQWLHHGVQFVAILFVLLGSVRSLDELDAQKYSDALAMKTPLLVLVYSDDCTDCPQAEATLEAMSIQGDITQLIPNSAVFKQRPDGPVQATSLGIKSFPSLVLLRGDVAAIYAEKFDSSDPIFFWLEKAGPTPLTQILTDDTFEHLTQASTGSTTGHWAVFFYRKLCEEHLHILESVGVNEKLWMNMAKVDLDANPKLSERFQITACPELIYFREGKMYRYETQVYDIASLTSFVKTWYHNVKASVVPREPTAFDTLTEGIAMYIKSELEGENRNFFIAIVGGVAAIIAITSIFCCVTGGSDSKQKKD